MKRRPRDIVYRRNAGPFEIPRRELEKSDDEEEEQRRELGRSDYLHQPRARANPADVGDRQAGQQDDEKRRARHAARPEAERRRDRVGHDDGDRGTGDDIPAEPDEEAGEKTDERPEGCLDVGVRTPRARHPAPQLGEAEADQAHEDRAGHIPENGRRAQDAGDHGRQHEDPRAHGHVDDVGRQRPPADAANQAFVGVSDAP